MANAIAYSEVAAQADPAERAAFIRRTYTHLAGAILAFIALEYFLLNYTDLPKGMINFISSGRYAWLMVLMGFGVLGWMARSFAASSASVGMQYFGLCGYVVAEAIIFVPILAIAQAFSSSSLIPMAGLMTLVLFAGLTLTVFTTRHDFSPLRSFLIVGGCVALGLIVCGAVFGFQLGLIFSGAMVILAAASILYDTSNVMLRFPTDRHVAASLELFASVALLFWYVLRIMMAVSGSRR